MQWIIYPLIAFTLFLHAAAARAATPVGMWVWRADALEDEARARELVDFGKAQGIRTLLVQVHFAEGSPLEPRLRYEEGLRRLLKLAREAGVQVEALDGSSEMALAEGRASALARLDAVLAFQATQPKGERFSAIHYDIEPYTLPRWKEGAQAARTIAREMLETYTLLRDRVRAEDPDLPVKFDIPAWYDTKPELALDFGGATKRLNEHIADIADEVVLMSYRRKATGHNSVEEMGRRELAYAARTGNKLSFALETIRLKEDPQISFHGVPVAQFHAVVRELVKTFEGQPGFGGLYLHHYDSLKTYLPADEPLLPATNE